MTRLISRIRWTYAPGAGFKVLGMFTEFGDHVAVRRILQGVRDRAEGRASPPLWFEAFEIAGWLVAFFEFCLAIVLIAVWRCWKIAWVLALGAGAPLQFILYSGTPGWIVSVLPWLYLVLMIRWWLGERSSRMQGSVIVDETPVS